MDVITLDPLGGAPAEPDWASEISGRSKAVAAERLVASRYWGMAIRELQSANKLAIVNGHAVKRLVLSWLLYDRAALEVMRQGPVVPAPKTKTPMHNPWAAVMVQAAKTAASIERELTISVATRDDGAPVPTPPRSDRLANRYLKR